MLSQNAWCFGYGGTNARGWIHLVQKDNTNMDMTLEFGLEDFGLCDWALRCFIPVFKVHDSSFYVCVVLGFGVDFQFRTL